jgi:hypothetical protein
MSGCRAGFFFFWCSLLYLRCNWVALNLRFFFFFYIYNITYKNKNKERMVRIFYAREKHVYDVQGFTFKFR